MKIIIICAIITCLPIGLVLSRFLYKYLSIILEEKVMVARARKLELEMRISNSLLEAIPHSIERSETEVSNPLPLRIDNTD